MFRTLLVLSSDMHVIPLCQGFLIILQLRVLLIPFGNETPVGLPEGFDGGLVIIGLDPDATAIIIIRVLFELEGVLELTGG